MPSGCTYMARVVAVVPFDGCLSLLGCADVERKG